jgi:hypothetical protein
MNDCARKVAGQQRLQHDVLAELRCMCFPIKAAASIMHVNEEGSYYSKIGEMLTLIAAYILQAQKDSCHVGLLVVGGTAAHVCRRAHQDAHVTAVTHPKPMPATRMVQKMMQLMMKTPFQPPSNLCNGSGYVTPCRTG